MPLHKATKPAGAQFHFEVFEDVLPSNTIFLHGNLASNRWWYPALEQIKRQKNPNWKGKAIFAEFLGCGKSSAPKTADDVNMRAFAEEFLNLVKTNNFGPVNVVGHSTGGLIAALMMAQAPETVKSGLLLDPVGAQGVKFDNSMLDAFAQMKVNKELVAMVMGSTIYQNKPESDFFKQVVVEDAFHAVQTVGPWVLQALDGFDCRQELARAQQPCLVLHGEHDLLLPIEDSRNLAALMKNAKFEVVKDQGHCTNAENPAKFVEIMLKFMARIPS